MTSTIQPTNAVLGEKYRCRTTGFEGVAVCRSDWLYGCVRITLQRADKDGKPEECTFDEDGLELVAAPLPEMNRKRRGGGRDAPARAADPSR